MESIIQSQKAYFKTHATRPLSARLEALTTLENLIVDNEQKIKDALKKDLNKSSFEAYTTEIGFALHSLRKTKKKLKRWMKAEKVRTPLYHAFTKSYVKPEPKGTVLIIGPYNYPFQLVVEPLIGALSAGNTAIVKPSEFPSYTEALIETLFNEAFDPRLLKVISGGVEVTKSLLEHAYDHIFFTGSSRVGQIVYEAASKHLTPVTLELGGKTPTIVSEHANLQRAAERIAFGKLLNAGQTCIAPDHIYVHTSVKEAFKDKLIQTFDAFYQTEASRYPVIINDKHFKRIVEMIDREKVVYGGSVDEEKRLIVPTIMDNIQTSDAVMKEEIFGPLMPLLTYNDLGTLIESLNDEPSPLALYMFSENKTELERVFDDVRFGGGAMNDTITHVANPNLPFGGVGRSGFGQYHGYYSFKEFSHFKTYIKKSTRFDPGLTKPPYDAKKERLVKKVLK